jgi:hypothetical protein
MEDGVHGESKKVVCSTDGDVMRRYQERHDDPTPTHLRIGRQLANLIVLALLLWLPCTAVIILANEAMDSPLRLYSVVVTALFISCVPASFFAGLLDAIEQLVTVHRGSMSEAYLFDALNLARAEKLAAVQHPGGFSLRESDPEIYVVAAALIEKWLVLQRERGSREAPRFSFLGIDRWDLTGSDGLSKLRALDLAKATAERLVTEAESRSRTT